MQASLCTFNILLKSEEMNYTEWMIASIQCMWIFFLKFPGNCSGVYVIVKAQIRIVSVYKMLSTKLDSKVGCQICLF